MNRPAIPRGDCRGGDCRGTTRAAGVPRPRRLSGGADQQGVIAAAGGKLAAIYQPWATLPVADMPPPSSETAYAALWPLEVNGETVNESDCDNTTRQMVKLLATNAAGLAAAAYASHMPHPNDPKQTPPATSGASKSTYWIIGGGVLAALGIAYAVTR
jgi:hypothetical protein